MLEVLVAELVDECQRCVESRRARRVVETAGGVARAELTGESADSTANRIDRHYDVSYPIIVLSASNGRIAVQRGVPRPPSTAKQIAIRIPAACLQQADDLVPLLERPGFQTTRSDVLRAAIIRGLEVMREELEGNVIVAASREPPAPRKKPRSKR